MELSAKFFHSPVNHSGSGSPFQQRGWTRWSLKPLFALKFEDNGKYPKEKEMGLATECCLKAKVLSVLFMLSILTAYDSAWHIVGAQ